MMFIIDKCIYMQKCLFFFIPAKSVIKYIFINQ